MKIIIKRILCFFKTYWLSFLFLKMVIRCIANYRDVCRQKKMFIYSTDKYMTLLWIYDVMVKSTDNKTDCEDSLILNLYNIGK